MIEEELEAILNGEHKLNETQKKKLLNVLFLAKKHLDKHNLFGVQFNFKKMRRNTLGQCDSDDKITLNLNFALNSSLLEIEDVIIHEIAHAIVGVEHNHDVKWQLKAIELGLSMSEIKNYKL